MGLGAVPGLGVAAGGGVVGVVAVAGVPDDDEAVGDQSERHGALHGAVGAVAWVALSGLFALYTALSNSFSKTYGALAGGIVLLLWLNYTAWAILFGAELNAQLDRQNDIRAAGGEHAGLTRPARRPG